jgi:type VI secretion system protein
MRSRLFERLSGEVHTQQVDVAQLCRSIERHITQLLCVRQGSCQTAPDLGLPDLNYQHLTYDESTRLITRQLRQVIGRYEPRLMNVQIIPKPERFNSMCLSYQVAGDILVKGIVRPVIFETALGGHVPTSAVLFEL